MHQLGHGRDPFFRSLLISDLQPRYLSWLEGNNKSALYIARSKQAINKVLRRTTRVKTPQDITPTKVQDLKTRQWSGKSSR